MTTLVDSPPQNVLDDPPPESDNTTSDEGPKRRRTRSDAGKPRGGRGRGVTAIAKKLTSGFHLVGGLLMAVDMYDGMVVSANAEKLGDVWAPVVKENEKLVRVLNQLEKGGGVGVAIVATLSVALPIVAHHFPQHLPPPLRAYAQSLEPEEAKQLREMYEAVGGNAPDA